MVLKGFLKGIFVNRAHTENHLIERIGWLRAAVLGANDGIISTSSLLVGVAAASTSSSEVIVAGVAGLVAGATAMAAGEYVSVRSQADTEAAEAARTCRTTRSGTERTNQYLCPARTRTFIGASSR
jgi:VIT1/CCC1 family predicted Fe2+/Mn2+ transporter